MVNSKILKEASPNIRVKKETLLLNVEYITPENLRDLPKVADEFLGLKGIKSVVVYGIGGRDIYILSKEKKSKKLSNYILDAFQEMGSVKESDDMTTARIPLGILQFSKDRSKVLGLTSDLMEEAIFGPAEGNNSFAASRLEGIKELINHQAKTAEVWQ